MVPHIRDPGLVWSTAACISHDAFGFAEAERTGSHHVALTVLYPHTLLRWANCPRSPAIHLASPDTRLQMMCQTIQRPRQVWRQRGRDNWVAVTASGPVHCLGLKKVRSGADNDKAVDAMQSWERASDRYLKWQKMHHVHMISRMHAS